LHSPVDIRKDFHHSFIIPSDIRQELALPRDTPGDVLQGTLDLLVLKTLALQPLHGWGIAQRIQQLSEDALAVGQGSVYPALVRLQHRGLIDDEWGTTENNRRARYYRITPLGRRQLQAETSDWRKYARAVELILRAT
jgi:transcriptional regulator